MANKHTDRSGASRHSLLVRIVALVMTGLVASGAVVYLILFIMSLFGG
jgi:hypothetical protein